MRTLKMIPRFYCNILSLILLVYWCQKMHGFESEYDIGLTNLVELTDKSFKEKVLESYDIWLVEFYLPWCEECTSSETILLDVSTAMLGLVKVGRLDGSIHQQTTSKYEISVFPTLKRFDKYNKTLTENYTGNRTVSEIMYWVMDKYYANIELNDQIFYAAVLESNDLWLVQFYLPWRKPCKNIESIWAEASTELKNVAKFGKLDAAANKEIARKYQVTRYPTIKLFDKNDKTLVEDYTGNYETSSEIVKWVMKDYDKANRQGRSNILDYIKRLDRNNFNDIVVKSKETWLVEVYLPLCTRCQYFNGSFHIVASKMQQMGIKVGIIDWSECGRSRVCETLTQVKRVPALRLFVANDKENPRDCGLCFENWKPKKFVKWVKKQIVRTEVEF